MRDWEGRTTAPQFYSDDCKVNVKIKQWMLKGHSLKWLRMESLCSEICVAEKLISMVVLIMRIRKIDINGCFNYDNKDYDYLWQWESQVANNSEST